MDNGYTNADVKMQAPKERVWLRQRVEMADVVTGMCIAAAPWGRPREVLCVDADASGPILTLREPDPGRADHKGHRRVNVTAWASYDGWHVFQDEAGILMRPEEIQTL